MKNSPFQIFKNGSKTYYYSSVFFPKHVRKEVATLYSFVRQIDDMVDSVPQKKKEFYRHWKMYRQRKECGVDFIDSFKMLMKKANIEQRWVEAFWRSMELDLIKPTHKTLKETEEYMYGSAEVIGLMMARVLQLPQKAEQAAQKLGRAMQYANFIRDISEDMGMKRNYLQVKDKDSFLHKFNILKKRYIKWQQEAELGYQYIPKRYLIPIKTAAEMYKWTINKIEENPRIVFTEKVKPKKSRIIMTGILIGITS